MRSLTFFSESFWVFAMSTRELSNSDSSTLSMEPFLSLSHMSKMILKWFQNSVNDCLLNVARCRNSPELVISTTFGEENDGVEELLEADPVVAVLVHDVEHLLDEQVTSFHPQSLFTNLISSLNLRYAPIDCPTCANSSLDKVVLMTMMTSLVASSSLRFSPGLRPKVSA